MKPGELPATAEDWTHAAYNYKRLCDACANMASSMEEEAKTLLQALHTHGVVEAHAQGWAGALQQRAKELRRLPSAYAWPPF